MELVCNTCGTVIEAQNVNIATDMAKCESCNSLMRASELAEKVELKELLQTPAGSTVKLEQGAGKSIVITAPKAGFTGANIGMSIFSIFWLGFITVWTIGASMGSIFFALFSIPFWIVGFLMAFTTFKRANTNQKLTLNDRELRLETLRPFHNSNEVIHRRSIIDIRMYNMKGEQASVLLKHMKFQKSTNTQPYELPAIITSGKKHFFFEFVTEAEQRWAVKLLHQLVMVNR